MHKYNQGHMSLNTKQEVVIKYIFLSLKLLDRILEINPNLFLSFIFDNNLRKTHGLIEPKFEYLVLDDKLLYI